MHPRSTTTNAQTQHGTHSRSDQDAAMDEQGCSITSYTVSTAAEASGVLFRAATASARARLLCGVTLNIVKESGEEPAWCVDDVTYEGHGSFARWAVAKREEWIKKCLGASGAELDVSSYDASCFPYKDAAGADDLARAGAVIFYLTKRSKPLHDLDDVLQRIGSLGHLKKVLPQLFTGKRAVWVDGNSLMPRLGYMRLAQRMQNDRFELDSSQVTTASQGRSPPVGGGGGSSSKHKAGQSNAANKKAKTGSSPSQQQQPHTPAGAHGGPLLVALTSTSETEEDTVAAAAAAAGGGGSGSPASRAGMKDAAVNTEGVVGSDGESGDFAVEREQLRSSNQQLRNSSQQLCDNNKQLRQALMEAQRQIQNLQQQRPRVDPLPFNPDEQQQGLYESGGKREQQEGSDAQQQMPGAPAAAAAAAAQPPGAPSLEKPSAAQLQQQRAERLRQLRDREQQLTSTNRQLQALIKSLRQQLKAAEQQRDAADVERLREKQRADAAAAQLVAVEKELDEAAEQLQAAIREHDAAVAELQEEQRRADAADAQLRAVERERDAAIAERDSIRAAYAQLEQELDAALGV